jgi:hypothetical protein
MKNKKIYIWAAFTLFMVTATIFSCKKSDLDTTDPNVVTTGQYYKTAIELTKGVNATYKAAQGLNLVAREWFFIHDLRSDEVSPGGSQLEVPRAQMLAGNFDPTNSVLNSVWNGWYQVIFRANIVLDNAPSVTDDIAIRDRRVGEAKFLRAWAYFDLVSQWGGVPLYTTTVKGVDEFQPRADVAAVYALITKDLQDAAAVLPGKSGTDKGRATNAAANALLARVLMQNGDYGGAKAALLKIPTSGADGYSLTNRFLDNFEEETEFNSESIFEMVYVDKGDNGFNWGGDTPTEAQTTVRNQEYNPIAWRNLIPSNRLLNEFENTATGAAKTDPRYKDSFYETGDSYNNGASVLTAADQNNESSVVNGVTKKVGFRKFMIIYKEGLPAASFHPGGNNQRILRYAEVLINLAECENELGNTAAAVAYLNMVRARPSVAMPAYPTAQFPVASKANVTKAIMHEKMVEMADEQVRNIDILRWRKKGYFTTDPLPYFKPNKDELLPIPTAELDNNPSVNGHQNPGY